MKETLDIKIYSTPSCHYCKEAEIFLTSNGFTFKKLDVASNLEDRKEMMDISEQRSVPVITIGKEIYVGFGDIVKNQIKKQLGIK